MKALQTVSSSFSLAFPGVPVYYTLGNNDVPEKDYEVFFFFFFFFIFFFSNCFFFFFFGFSWGSCVLYTWK